MIFFEAIEESTATILFERCDAWRTIDEVKRSKTFQIVKKKALKRKDRLSKNIKNLKISEILFLMESSLMMPFFAVSLAFLIVYFARKVLDGPLFLTSLFPVLSGLLFLAGDYVLISKRGEKLAPGNAKEMKNRKILRECILSIIDESIDEVSGKIRFVRQIPKEMLIEKHEKFIYISAVGSSPEYVKKCLAVKAFELGKSEVVAYSITKADDHYFGMGFAE